MNEPKRPIEAASLANTESKRSIETLRYFGRHLILLFAMLILANVEKVSADSAIDLVAGFDAERIENVFPIDKQSIGEAAKLLYRVEKASPESFVQRIEADKVGDGTNADAVGNAVQFEGVFVGTTAYAIPDSLVELLGFKSISLVSIETDQDEVLQVISSSVPAGCKPGDRFNVIGMVVKVGDVQNAVEAVVAAKMSWYPRVAANASWQWLADRGVDISTLPGLKTRDRRPLSSADTEAFYSIMAAAAGMPPLSQQEQLSLQEQLRPKTVKPIDLLSDPNSLVANFITRCRSRSFKSLESSVIRR